MSTEKIQERAHTTSDEEKVFWRVRLEAPDLEERSDEIWELGICGLQVRTPDELICTLECTRLACEEFRVACEHLGIAAAPADRVVPESWVQRDPSVWARQDIGEISVLPSPDARSARHARESALATSTPLVLIPGEGFGTGHHESTQLALLFMQDARVRSSSPRHVLDLGTGSGILAIGAAILFPEAAVTGIDIEAAALANAAENALLNGVGSRIALYPGSLPVTKVSLPPAELLAANLYAEVLVTLSPSILEATAPGGFLILSGITSNRVPLIRDAFSPTSWEEVRVEERVRPADSSETGSWTAFLFRRRLTENATEKRGS